MQRTSDSAPITLWTIGHSNHPLQTFVDLLTRNGIQALIDVRSNPYSRDRFRCTESRCSSQSLAYLRNV
jgi:uncharacterized protein (DUF488 family)